MIKILPVNNAGRDFVIGDLHGAFDPLDRFMKFSRFDPKSDRMFSVGDLVDRGPKNLECLRLVNEPWFHVVMGNHEAMMIDYVMNGGVRDGAWWMYNGGGWFNELTVEEREETVSILSAIRLPVCIEVPGQFRVIHAELASACSEDEFYEEFADIAFKATADGPAVTWGRCIFGYMYGSQVSDDKIKRVSKNTHSCGDLPIFCGHTTLQHPTKLGNFINLDTGAARVGMRSWTGLTVAEPKTGKFWKVTDDINEVELKQ